MAPRALPKGKNPQEGSIRTTGLSGPSGPSGSGTGSVHSEISSHASNIDLQDQITSLTTKFDSLKGILEGIATKIEKSSRSNSPSHPRVPEIPVSAIPSTQISLSSHVHDTATRLPSTIPQTDKLKGRNDYRTWKFVISQYAKTYGV
jgi:hypothetical protein